MGIIWSPLVGIGLTDLPKSGGGDSPPAPSVFTALRLDIEQDGSMSSELEKWAWTSTNMHTDYGHPMKA